MRKITLFVAAIAAFKPKCCANKLARIFQICLSASASRISKRIFQICLSASPSRCSISVCPANRNHRAKAGQSITSFSGLSSTMRCTPG
jgi:hypothetical protein